MNTNFARGIYARAPHPKAPDFVKCELSFKVEDAVAWLQEHPNYEGWVKVTVKEARDGKKWYVVLNTWVPEKKESGDDPAADIPF